jgi:hypothetical protein
MNEKYQKCCPIKKIKTESVVLFLQSHKQVLGFCLKENISQRFVFFLKRDLSEVLRVDNIIVV